MISLTRKAFLQASLSNVYIDCWVLAVEFKQEIKVENMHVIW